jgi:hypothetical protein
MRAEMRRELAQLPFDESSQWELSEIDGQAEQLGERERTSQWSRWESSDIDGEAGMPS